VPASQRAARVSYGFYMELSRVTDWRDRPLHALWRISSRQRGWSGFDASLIRVSGGASEPVVLARHNVTMLAGAPLPTTATCDGQVARRMQATGTFDVLPAHSTVSWVDEGSSLFMAIGMNHDLLCETAFAMGVDAERSAFVPRMSCRDPRIEHLLWALKVELEADEPQGRLYADSIGVALASQLVRRYASATSRVPSGGLPKRRLRRVLAHIDERLTSDLSLAEIASVAGVSASHLKLLFKQSVGVPVHRYVMKRRVDRAAELLKHGRAPLADVALQAGFANQSHMARCLRRSLGVTPKVLRNSF
jgi:AraC family transcriptional regulator